MLETGRRPDPKSIPIPQVQVQAGRRRAAAAPQRPANARPRGPSAGCRVPTRTTDRCGQIKEGGLTITKVLLVTSQGQAPVKIQKKTKSSKGKGQINININQGPGRAGPRRARGAPQLTRATLKLKSEKPADTLTPLI